MEVMGGVCENRRRMLSPGGVLDGRRSGELKLVVDVTMVLQLQYNVSD